MARTASTSTSSRSPSGYEDEFTSLVRSVRTELDAVQKGYQLTFDTTGCIGNYPIEAATARRRRRRDLHHGLRLPDRRERRRPARSPRSRGRSYDIIDTIEAYTDARPGVASSSSACPTTAGPGRPQTDNLHSTNISGTKYGASSTVDLLVARSATWPTTAGATTPAEQVAWTAYQRENCTATYGCVTAWRQLYVDDAQALKAKYDLVNRYGLRGAGIWALGYDGTRTELWTAIRDKFINDSTPPRAGINAAGHRARRPRRSRSPGRPTTTSACARTTSTCRSMAGPGRAG